MAYANEYLTDTQHEQNLATQHTMREINQGIAVHVQHWANGLITDKEITAYFAKLNVRFAKLNVRGLIDPNTGLRYN